MPFFLSAGALSSDEKIRPRLGSGYGTMKKKILVREAPSKRTMDASPAFMEYRSVKKDRSLNRRTRDFSARGDSERWSGFFKIKVQRSKNTRRSVEKEGSPCGSGYPVVRGLNWEGG
jgi:hypothetical protein